MTCYKEVATSINLFFLESTALGISLSPLSLHRTPIKEKLVRETTVAHTIHPVVNCETRDRTLITSYWVLSLCPRNKNFVIGPARPGVLLA